jgi:hypothetical protein
MKLPKKVNYLLYDHNNYSLKKICNLDYLCKFFKKAEI